MRVVALWRSWELALMVTMNGVFSVFRRVTFFALSYYLRATAKIVKAPGINNPWFVSGELSS
jgi:hypothetical protein